jgi:Uma2 family endonuclease
MGFLEKKLFTVEEYLELERNATEKSEYFQGEIFAMSGASFIHNEIFGNIFGELTTKLKGKTCRPYGSDLRTSVQIGNLFAYPDVSIICGNPDFTDDKFDTVKNPTVIFEILSPSTRNYDLGGKFLLYKQIETLKEYILIDSESTKVIKYSRNDDNSWLMTEMNLLDEYLKLDSVQIELQLIDIYDNVKFN